MRSRGGRERGSASVEASLVVPAFGLLVALVVVGGRITIAHQVVESAAADAARSASLQRAPGPAHDAATSAAATTLTGQGLDCASTTVDVVSTGLGGPVGDDSTVTVTVTCQVSLTDLTFIPGLPGTRAVTATVTSPVDRWTQR
ncbi:TadE family protein [Xylanimonas protaetiae]|uniref:Pilus assembly protein n=1 Tax=Xylanimonas protaetiae TaxID=2509457 RepID=A0A4P6F6L1_9MICO|nr:TadE family protein [Xylanimonas protaetiae]QAY71630.1 pilus assembly protein [Xylanimonas protaetiae]